MTKLPKEILQLISDFESDSKTKSLCAEKSLIKICEPIIKKYYDITMEYNQLVYNVFNELSSDIFSEEYSSDRGDLVKFLRYNKEDNSLEFLYKDGCLGEVWECTVSMPVDWFDENYKQTFRKQYKDSIIKKLNTVLEQHERKKAGILDTIDKLQKL